MRTKGDVNNFFRMEYGMSYKEFKHIKDENELLKIKPKKTKEIELQDQKSQLNIYFKNETGMTYEEFSKIKFYNESTSIKRVKKDNKRIYSK